MDFLLPDELTIGNYYILSIYLKNGELQFSCRGEFFKIHKKEFCTLFDFRNIRSKFKTKRILIDPYLTHIITVFHDAEERTLQQMCWSTLSDEDKIWLKNQNHTYSSLAIS